MDRLSTFPGTIKVRDLLKLPISADVVGGSGTWAVPFDGPIELTADAVAKWGSLGVLDRKVKMVNGDIAVQGVMEYKNEVDVCSLFATIGGHANDANYRKYIKGIPADAAGEMPEEETTED